MSTLETQYKNYLIINPNSNYTFEVWMEKVKKPFLEYTIQQIKKWDKVNVRVIEPQPTNGIRTIDTITSTDVSLHHPIKFGRWLLKYAAAGWDEGALCWQYEGRYYDTDELYNEFCRMQQ